MNDQWRTADPDAMIDSNTLRILVGVQGVALPIILPLVCLLRADVPAFRPTISDYYSSVAGDLFVGVLFTIGGCLLAYRGTDWKDRWAGNLAFVCALGVALFPTGQPATHLWHISFAATLFVILALFAIVLFRRDLPRRSGWEWPKGVREWLFVASGAVILLCIVKLGTMILLHVPPGRFLGMPVGWFLESLALWAFGISWFVKGEGHRRVYAAGVNAIRRVRRGT